MHDGIQLIRQSLYYNPYCKLISQLISALNVSKRIIGILSSSIGPRSPPSASSNLTNQMATTMVNAASGLKPSSVAHCVAQDTSSWALLIGTSVGRPQEIITFSFKDVSSMKTHTRNLCTAYGAQLQEALKSRGPASPHHSQADHSKQQEDWHDLGPGSGGGDQNKPSVSVVAGQAQLRHILRALLVSQGSVPSWSRPSGEDSISDNRPECSRYQSFKFGFIFLTAVQIQG